MDEVEKLIRQLTSDEDKVRELLMLIDEQLVEKWEQGQAVGFESGWQQAVDLYAKPE